MNTKNMQSVGVGEAHEECTLMYGCLAVNACRHPPDCRMLMEERARGECKLLVHLARDRNVMVFGGRLVCRHI